MRKGHSTRASRVLYALKELMTAPTERDLQSRVGPSDLGDPCDYCLGRKMRGIKPKRLFSMYPWLGSAMHAFIEKLTAPGVLKWVPGANDLAWEVFGDARTASELKIKDALHIRGYGPVTVHIDMLLLTEGCIVDWKSTSKRTLKTYMIKMTVPQYSYIQVQLYLKAARDTGYNVSWGVLVYIPRDAADLDEMWAFDFDYDEAAAQGALDRAADIQKWIDAGRAEELAHHPDCKVCHPGGAR